MPKRLRLFLADRPETVTTLTTIFLAAIERFLCTAAGASHAGNAPPSVRPKLGAISFAHRFGSALNRHVHGHACVTDAVFATTDAREGVAFGPARPISPTRGPSTAWGDLVQVHDDRDVVQASPAELPVIDIHSL